MNKADEDKINKLIHRLGLKYNLRDIEIKEIIESQFKFTYEKIIALDLDIKKEELENLKTTFYFKYLGKLFINEHTFKEKKKDGE